MTLDVARLRRLLEEGTPGPWHWKRGPNGGYIRKGRRDLGYMNGDIAAIGDPKQQQIDRDAALIVAMHAALPELLDKIEQLRQEVERSK